MPPQVSALFGVVARHRDLPVIQLSCIGIRVAGSTGAASDFVHGLREWPTRQSLLVARQLRSVRITSAAEERWPN
jgi:hypothetical protein